MAALVKIPLYDNIKRFIRLNPKATEGADIGVDLRYQGKVVRAEDIINPAPTPGSSDRFPITLWRRLLEIPANVVALANTITTGLYVITGPGTSETREIEHDALLSVTNPDGVAGNPRIATAALVHTELSSASPWVINHNLGRRVNVGVYTAGGVEVLAEVLLASDNQAVVTFDAPTAGYAVID